MSLVPLWPLLDLPYVSILVGSLDVLAQLVVVKNKPLNAYH